MRILFLAHRLPYPPNKGDKIRSFWELKAMSARHEVDLFCFYDDKDDARYLPDVRQYCRQCYAEPISPFWSRARSLAAVATHRPFSTAYYYSSTMARQIERALQMHAYDLIWIFSSPMAQYAEGSTLPKVVDFVDVDSDKWQQYSKRTHVPSSWLWAYEARQLARYEDFIAQKFSLSVLCTEAEARILRARVPAAPVYALNNHLDTKYFDPQAVPLTPEIQALQPYVVFTGQMDYYPNVDAALHFYRDVFPAVRAELPQLKFVIAGRNPAASLRKLTSDSAVRVTGVVPDIRLYLKGAAAAVMPLRLARGIQNKVLEALAMGLPVATSSTLAAALPAEVSSLLMVEDDANLMAGKLVTLLRTAATLPVMAFRNAVSAAFGRSDVEAQLERILQQALAHVLPSAPNAAARVNVTLDEEKRSMPISAGN